MKRIPLIICTLVILALAWLAWTTRFSIIPRNASSGQDAQPAWLKVDRWTGRTWKLSITHDNWTPISTNNE